MADCQAILNSLNLPQAHGEAPLAAEETALFSVLLEAAAQTGEPAFQGRKIDAALHHCLLESFSTRADLRKAVRLWAKNYPAKEDDGNPFLSLVSVFLGFGGSYALIRKAGNALAKRDFFMEMQSRCPGEVNPKAAWQAFQQMKAKAPALVRLIVGALEAGKVGIYFTLAGETASRNFGADSAKNFSMGAALQIHLLFTGHPFLYPGFDDFAQRFCGGGGKKGRAAEPAPAPSLRRTSYRWNDFSPVTKVMLVAGGSFILIVGGGYVLAALGVEAAVAGSSLKLAEMAGVSGLMFFLNQGE